MVVIESLSTKEKKIILLSLPEINKHIEFFTLRFYHYLLHTKAEVLFRNTNFESQYKMFNTALNVIITHIADPTQLEDYLLRLIQIHANFGVNSDHIDDFIVSFMKALQEIFNEEKDEIVIEIWFKVISDVMLYFRNNLQ